MCKCIRVSVVLFIMACAPTVLANPSPSTDILEIVNKYNIFQQKLGNNTQFNIDQEIIALFNPNFKKTTNGVVTVDGRYNLKKQLEDLKAMAGTWEIVIKEKIPCLDPNRCIIRFHIFSKNSGNFDVMAVLKKNTSGLIEEINEIYYKMIP